jgi:tape measure domain-containing protein
MSDTLLSFSLEANGKAAALHIDNMTAAVSSLNAMVTASAVRTAGFGRSLYELGCEAGTSAEALRALTQAAVYAEEQMTGSFNVVSTAAGDIGRNAELSMRSLSDVGRYLQDFGEKQAKMFAAGSLSAKSFKTDLTKMFGKVNWAATAVAAGKQGFEKANNRDDIVTAYRGLTGSLEEANNLYAEMRFSAAANVMGLDELSDAAGRLVSSGARVSDVGAQLDMLGTLAHSSSASFDELAGQFTRVQSGAQLSGRELQQLQTQGVPVLDALAESLGLSSDEVLLLAANGLLMRDELMTAFDTAALKAEAAGQGLGRAALSFGTLWGNNLNDINALLAGLITPVNEIGKLTGEVLRPAFQTLAAIGNTLSEVWTEVFDAIKNMSVFQGFMQTIQELFGMIQDFAKRVADPFKAIYISVFSIINAVAELGKSLVRLLFPQLNTLGKDLDESVGKFFLLEVAIKVLKGALFGITAVFLVAKEVVNQFVKGINTLSAAMANPLDFKGNAAHTKKYLIDLRKGFAATYAEIEGIKVKLFGDSSEELNKIIKETEDARKQVEAQLAAGGKSGADSGSGEEGDTDNAINAIDEITEQARACYALLSKYHQSNIVEQLAVFKTDADELGKILKRDNELAKITADLADPTKTEEQIAELNKEKSDLIDYRKDLLKLLNIDEGPEADAQLDAKVKEAMNDIGKAKIRGVAAAASQVIGTVSNLVADVSKTMAMFAQNDTDRLNAEHKKQLDDFNSYWDAILDGENSLYNQKKDLLEQNYNDGLMTELEYMEAMRELDEEQQALEEQKAEEQKALEEQQKAEKNEQAKKAFETERAFNIVQTLMSGAQAIMGVWASMSSIPIVGPALAAVQTAGVTAALFDEWAMGNTTSVVNHNSNTFYFMQPNATNEEVYSYITERLYRDLV